jgi:hypothetical protein
MVLTRREVLSRIEVEAHRLRALGVRSLALFGSAARDEAGPESDLDFVVELDLKTFDAYMDVKHLLEDLFGRPVDLVMSGSVKPRLRSIILREAIHAPGF